MLKATAKAAALAMLAMSLAQPANAGSYLCSAEQRVECMNGKSCKAVSVKDTEYFIIDTANQKFEDCELEDCQTRAVLFWGTEHNPLIVSHRNIPRTTRLALYGKDGDYTQATLSSVMTVMESGTCFERIAVSPPTLVK